MRVLSTVLMSFVFFSCNNEPKNDILGKWMMYKIIREGKDVSEEHNPYNERYVLFKEDGHFESDGRPYGKNTGKYEYNADLHELFLDSDSGSEDNSNWKIRIYGDTMRWQGLGTPWAKAFELVHIRVE